MVKEAAATKLEAERLMFQLMEVPVLMGVPIVEMWAEAKMEVKGLVLVTMMGVVSSLLELGHQLERQTEE